jgi:hypothetical protein
MLPKITLSKVAIQTSIIVCRIVILKSILTSVEFMFVNVYAQKKPTTTKNAEVMSIAITALVNTKESTVECTAMCNGVMGYSELKKAVEAVIMYMLAKMTLKCTKCEKRIASACN